LLLWSVKTALVAPLTATNDIVYEAKFASADFYQGFSSNAIYLRLSARYINQMLLTVNTFLMQANVETRRVLINCEIKCGRFAAFFRWTIFFCIAAFLLVDRE